MWAGGGSPEALNRGAGASLPWVGAGWSQLPVLVDGRGGGPPSQLLRRLTASHGPPTLIQSHASADRGSRRVISDGRLDRHTQGWGGRGRGRGVREGGGDLLGGHLEGHRRASKNREWGPHTAAGVVANWTLGL